MDTLARDYHHAHRDFNGHLLAATISPIAPPHYLNRLDAIYHASNNASIQRDVSYVLTKHAHRSITKEDRLILETWTEIYVAYWHVAGAILAAQDLETARADWAKVYEAWKDLANAVIRGYSNGSLENWTLPVLYFAGRHLRIFAIKADQSKKIVEGEASFNTNGLQDDIAGDFERNEKLEDAARVINRMFTLCISDRYVVMSIKTSLDRVGSAKNVLIEHQLKIPGNGVSTISQTSSSKHTSSSTQSVCPKTSSEPSLLRRTICHSSKPFQNPTS